jgi:hypothetical protein
MRPAAFHRGKQAEKMKNISAGGGFMPDDFLPCSAVLSPARGRGYFYKNYSHGFRVADYGEKIVSRLRMAVTEMLLRGGAEQSQSHVTFVVRSVLK